VKCACCNEPLTTFMAYIPGKGDVCLGCFNDYVKADENMLITRALEEKRNNR